MAQNINTSIDDFTAMMAPDCPGCPDFLKQKAVLQKARDFFKQTRSWRETIEGHILCKTDKEIDANLLAYQFSRYCTVLETNDMWLSDDGTPLTKLSKESLDKNIPGWQSETDSEPTGYFMNPKGIIRIYPYMADDADNVNVDIELILIPLPTMTTFPDFAYNLFGEIITAGANMQILMQPGQPWSDPQRAGYFSGIWKQGIGDARNEQSKKVVDAINASNRQYFI